MSLFILKYKPQLLFHHTARFPWHALFLNSRLPSLQCQVSPRSNLSGMLPVRTPDLPIPHPPVIHRTPSQSSQFGVGFSDFVFPHRLRGGEQNPPFAKLS
jgi:hypothetical protein